MKTYFYSLLFTLTLLAGATHRVHAQAPFAKGADVGWLTEMEAAGYTWQNAAGVQQDLLQILRGYDLNTIRLRVWVDPAGGWNGKNDVIAKAIRARNMGFRILIDFHYSDSWADPGQQNKPAAWRNLTFRQLKGALYDHTYDVLDSLKDNNIVPEWVQVGNETNDGMLWPDGRRSTNPQNFAALIDTGYVAVKAVNPTSKVIVHISNGYNNSYFRNVFDGLAVNGARYDVIGMSLYPTAANWPTLTAQCQANMNDMVSRYPGKEVMVVEVGMPVNVPVPCREMLLDLMAKTRAVPGSKGLGVLYWEPEAYNWRGYNLGAWSGNGQPTVAMDAFRNSPPSNGLIYNPGFEYTAATQSPLGWSTAGDADADFTQNYGQASLFQLTHQRATAYQVRTYQVLTAVPNGTYTLRAWAQRTGSQSTCQLYAAGFGSSEQSVTVPVASNWVQIQVPSIVVINGQCEIGLRSVGNANDICSLDDVELVPSQATATTATATPDALDARVFPNPGAGTRTLAYTLSRAENVEIGLYNLTGQLVHRILPAQLQPAGQYARQLNVSPALASGLYLLKITHGSQQAVLKLVQL